MTDFTSIIPADLLPEAVQVYSGVCELIDRAPAPTLKVVAPRKPADAAIAAALELAASLMVCGTCRHYRHDLYDPCDVEMDGDEDRPERSDEPLLFERCVYTPSRWQHYRDGEA